MSKIKKNQSSFKAPNRETWVKGKCRQFSLKWPPRNEALKRSRKDRGLYQCNMCKDLFKVKQVHVDHINPVIPINQQQFNWESFINNLFCDVEGFQILCTNCHDVKTRLEDDMRVYYRNNKKGQK